MNSQGTLHAVAFALLVMTTGAIGVTLAIIAAPLACSGHPWHSLLALLLAFCVAAGLCGIRDGVVKQLNASANEADKRG